MKRFLIIILALILCTGLFSCQGSTPDESFKQSTDEGIVEEYSHYIRFEMEDGDVFVVGLLPQYAPETVENFVSLVGQHFYDGLTFHRVISGFMIQGGAPNADGTGGTEPITGEFAINGYTQNTLLHTRGVISMARGTAPNTASCQFFIVHQDSHQLDGKYAAFGRVVYGMEVIDKIAAVEVDWQPYSTEKSKPKQPVVIAKVAVISPEEIPTE